MLYFVGGIPRAGKSQFAHHINLAKGVSVLSTDLLTDFAVALDPSSNMQFGTAVGVREEVFIGPFRGVLKNLARIDRNNLLEGDLITPRVIASVRDEVPFKAVFLGLSDATLENVLKYERDNVWVGKMTPEDQQVVMGHIKAGDQQLQRDCEEFDFPYVDMTDGDYEANVLRALTALGLQ